MGAQARAGEVSGAKQAKPRQEPVTIEELSAEDFNVQALVARLAGPLLDQKQRPAPGGGGGAKAPLAEARQLLDQLER